MASVQRLMKQLKALWPGMFAGGTIAVAVVLIRTDWDAIAASDETLFEILAIAFAVGVPLIALIWWLTRLSYRIWPPQDRQ